MAPLTGGKTSGGAHGIAEQLRSDIATGKLRPGDALQPIGTSRPRRAAYRILTAEGLVQYVNGRGLFVAGAAPCARPLSTGAFERAVKSAADRLRSDIASGVLLPGRSASIRAQGKRIGASVRATRLALLLLVQEGLVEQASGRGLFVAGGKPDLEVKSTRVVQWVRGEIASGALAPGDELPSTVELCKRLGVGGSSVTVAFRELKRSNEIRTFYRGAVVSGTESERRLPGDTVDLIVDDLRHAIARTMAPGDKFPTYDQIRSRFGASISSVNRAFYRLRKENLVVSRHGGGVFVADSPEVARLRNPAPGA